MAHPSLCPGTPNAALVVFFVYYGICLLLTWWFYTRKKGGNPLLKKWGHMIQIKWLRFSLCDCYGLISGESNELFYRPLMFFKSHNREDFSSGHGVTTVPKTGWEECVSRPLGA
jgi:hypothetical protein